jgi:hypothetical protein
LQLQHWIIKAHSGGTHKEEKGMIKAGTYLPSVRKNTRVMDRCAGGCAGGCVVGRTRKKEQRQKHKKIETEGEGREQFHFTNYSAL